MGGERKKELVIVLESRRVEDLFALAFHDRADALVGCLSQHIRDHPSQVSLFDQYRLTEVFLADTPHQERDQRVRDKSDDGFPAGFILKLNVCIPFRSVRNDPDGGLRGEGGPESPGERQLVQILVRPPRRSRMFPTARRTPPA